MDLKFLIVILIFTLLIFLVAILIVRINGRQAKGGSAPSRTQKSPESYVNVKHLSLGETEKIKKTDISVVNVGKKFNFAMKDGTYVDLVLLDDDTVLVLNQSYYEPPGDAAELLENMVLPEAEPLEAPEKDRDPGGANTAGTQEGVNVYEDEELLLFPETEAEPTTITKKYDLDNSGIEEAANDEDFFEKNV